MKKLIYLLIIFSLMITFPAQSFAQLKKDLSKPNVSGILTSPNNDFILGFLDLSKIQMQHSFSMSYGGFSGNGMMLGSYLNTINYQITDKLFIRTNLGIITSPYNTFGENFYLNDPKFFGGAELKYKFNESSSILLRFDYTPFMYYQPTLGQYYYNQFE